MRKTPLNLLRMLSGNNQNKKSTNFDYFLLKLNF